VNAAETSVAIAVASDRSLVADAVGAALAGSGLVIARVPWPDEGGESPPGWKPGADPPELALMLCDLEPASVQAARLVVSRYPTRWLLLTDAARGPLWGAMLEVGVVRILPSSTTMADLLNAVSELRAGAVWNSLADREALVQTWRRVDVQMSSLSGRELEVLRQLHLGRSVRQVAERNGVAQSTVRSQVRSVLRKLGVNSQLAAAAYYEKWVGGS